MKIALCALAAIAVSTVHTILSPDLRAASHRPSGNTVITVSNYTDFAACAVTATEPDTVYQAYVSIDQNTWIKAGDSFTGTGKMRLIPLLDAANYEHANSLYVRLEAH